MVRSCSCGGGRISGPDSFFILGLRAARCRYHARSLLRHRMGPYEIKPLSPPAGSLAGSALSPRALAQGMRKLDPKGGRQGLVWAILSHPWACAPDVGAPPRSVFSSRFTGIFRVKSREGPPILLPPPISHTFPPLRQVSPRRFPELHKDAFPPAPVGIRETWRRSS